MPRGNRMGPEGMGPMTGGGFGYCAGFEEPGFARPMVRSGYGRPRRGFLGRGGGGRFMRRRFSLWGAGYADPHGPDAEPLSEKDVLEERLAYHQRAVEGISGRLSELNEDES